MKTNYPQVGILYKFRKKDILNNYFVNFMELNYPGIFSGFGERYFLYIGSGEYMFSNNNLYKFLYKNRFIYTHFEEVY